MRAEVWGTLGGGRDGGHRVIFTRECEYCLPRCAVSIPSPPGLFSSLGCSSAAAINCHAREMEMDWTHGSPKQLSLCEMYTVILLKIYSVLHQILTPGVPKKVHILIDAIYVHYFSKLN